MSGSASSNAIHRNEQAAAWCIELAAGPLPPVEQTRFEDWLAEDPGNRAAFDDAVVLWRCVEEQASHPDLIGMRADALESARRAGRRRWTRGPRLRALAAAGVAIALLGAGFWKWSQPIHFETGIGERRLVVLDDGSKVSLDGATAVSVRYTRSRRELVLEEGRARFTVAKDALRPFSVASGERLVVATGTQFSVERLSREVRVVLYEGRVAVLNKPPGPAAPAPVVVGRARLPAEQLLRPGGELILTPTSATLSAIDPARSSAWEGGQLVFTDEPLSRALERINRYSETPIRLGDAAAGEIRISGVFSAGDGAAFVEGVTAAFPLKARTTRDGTTLESRSATVR